jgi:hypothetical protein
MVPKAPSRTNGGEEERVQVFGGKEPTRKTNTFVGGIYYDGSWRDRKRCIDWIVLAQDRDKWKALANAIMNLRLP